MPAPAVKPELPPAELRDRSEGWGRQGRIEGYPEYGDDGEWPEEVNHQLEFELYPSETSDGIWSHTL
jgi:hypothetical protein